jgi:quercetin dioxygenase-like cupin family protein
MTATVTRVQGVFDEGAVVDAFKAEGLSPSRWSNGPGDVYAAHSHAYHKVLYCLRGSITFGIVDTGEDIELQPGDRLDIEPGTSHRAVVGARGVTCIEAAR